MRLWLEISHAIIVFVFGWSQIQRRIILVVPLRLREVEVEEITLDKTDVARPPSVNKRACDGSFSSLSGQDSLEKVEAEEHQRFPNSC